MLGLLHAPRRERSDVGAKITEVADKAGSVSHSAQETAQKVIHGAKEVASTAGHRYRRSRTADDKLKGQREFALTEGEAMLNLLWAVAVICAVMWILGFTLHFTLGGLIHLLLVLAIISVLVRIIMGRRIA